MKIEIEDESSFNGEPIETISPQLGDIFLIITTILWGSTFLITNTLTQIIPPMFYMGVRYFIAFLGFLPFYGRLKKLTKQEFKICFTASLLAWASFAIQTFGIKWTTPTKSGFITGLNVIMVPFLAAGFFKKKIKWQIWLSSCFALVGVSILSFGEFGRFELGDLFILICDIFYALYIIYLEYNLKKVDTISFSIILVFNMSILSFLLSLITDDYSYIFNEGWNIIMTWQNLLIMLYMGLIASSIATLTQSYGQTVVSSTRAAIIYSLEPIFAALFAILFGSDQLSLQILIGGALIMVGIYISIISQSKTSFKKELAEI